VFTWVTWAVIVDVGDFVVTEKQQLVRTSSWSDRQKQIIDRIYANDNGTVWMTKTYSEHPAGLECGHGGEEQEQEEEEEEEEEEGQYTLW
jgi:hypothetical protein